MLKQDDKQQPIGVEKQLGLFKESEEPIMPGEEKPIEAKLKYGTQFHSDLIARIKARVKLGKDAVGSRYAAWDRVDEQVRLYANLSQGAIRPDGTTMTDTLEFPFERGIVVPASYATLMVRLSQLMSILTNRSPLWELSGNGPEDIRPARVMETILEYDMQQCLALLALYSQMQDSEKYGIGVIYDVWESEDGWRFVRDKRPDNPVASLVERMFKMPVIPRKEWGTVKEFNNWSNIDPYRFWCDPRVPKSRFQTGEFAGHRINRSYLYLVERSRDNGGPYFNLEKLPANQGESNDVLPKRDSILSTGLGLRGSTDPRDKGYYYLDCMQIKLIPKEWGLGSGTIPEIWWFTVANEAVIIRAHPSSYDHGQFTYSVIESNFDPHALHNAGNIESIDGLQRFMNWLLNSHLENIRKALNDVLVYSPALIEESDLLNPGPVRHIRLTEKGEQLLFSGLMNPGQFIQQLQVGDVTRPHLEAMKFVYEMAQLMMATNDPVTGQPTQKKKTLGEINQMMFGAGKRIGLSFRLNELMGWQPLVLRAISNRQQFTSREQYIRIAGDVLRTTPEMVERIMVGPNDLQGNFDYVCRSAMLPPDPGRQAMVWAQLMLGIGKFPQIMAPGPDGKVLDVRQIFNEAARNLGVRNIEQFYTQAPSMPPAGMGAPNVQVMPDEKVSREAAAGNLMPIPRLPGMEGMTP